MSKKFLLFLTLLTFSAASTTIPGFQGEYYHYNVNFILSTIKPSAF
ncbi:MAG: hypothetical protein GX783_07050 [Clostridiales bacterium]|nr:hypothetical protein [Clostridiales bacterium]